MTAKEIKKIMNELNHQVYNENTKLHELYTTAFNREKENGKVGHCYTYYTELELEEAEDLLTNQEKYQAERIEDHRNDLQKRYWELNEKRNELQKANKIKRDLAKGITPEKRKAMTYARNYQSKIDKLQREYNEQMAELKNKYKYWSEQAQQL